MAEPIVTMTNWQYWSRWILAGAAFWAVAWFLGPRIIARGIELASKR